MALSSALEMPEIAEERKREMGEQATFFLRDPSGNALEFKAFADPSRLFARDGD